MVMMEIFPRLVKAVISNQEDRFYLVDQSLDFIPEVRQLVDQKVRTGCAPGTVRGFCIKLRWYYRFLYQKQLGVLEVKSSDLGDFVLWLSDSYRSGCNQFEPLQRSTINQILHAVASLYKSLVRHGHLTVSPVIYEEVPRNWAASADQDLLAHTRRRGRQTVQRLAFKLKAIKSQPKTVSPDDFERFIQRIHIGTSPNSDPAGFRDRLIGVTLKETGLRCGELLGIRMEDLDFGSQGIHVRFRSDNENGSRAKAGYGRDRFVHLPPEIFGFLDIYVSEVWLNTNYCSDYLWLVLKKNAVNREGQSTFGRALTQSAVNEMFAYYSERSGIKIHPHMLRHTHATDLVRSYLSQGEPVDWKFIADRLGHSNVVTTMKTYVHLTKEDNKVAYKLYLTKKKESDAKRRQRKHASPSVD